MITRTNITVLDTNVYSRVIVNRASNTRLFKTRQTKTCLMHSQSKINDFEKQEKGDRVIYWW